MKRVVALAAVFVACISATAIAAPRGLRWTWETEPDGVTRFVVARVGKG